MYIKVKFVFSFYIITTIYCVNKIVWAGEKSMQSNTIVIQNGGGEEDDHDEEESIIYTPLPIPIPIQLKKSIVNPSYLYPIHQDPSVPNYRMTQRSIIHVASPAPNLHPTPRNLFNRVQPDNHYPLPPGHPNYNNRHHIPIHPSSNERQPNTLSSQPPPPLPQPPSLPLPSSVPPPPYLSETIPPPSMHLSQSRPTVSTNSPSFFPIQPMPNAAQADDDRDNRYFSLHEPWPPAYTNTKGDKNAIKMTSSTEVQNDGNSDNMYDDERNNNGNTNANNNNNNMADPGDVRDDGRNNLVDYPPTDQDYGQNYQNNYEKPDYNGNTDYREDYQSNVPKTEGGTETGEGSGNGVEDDYYPDYPQNSREYADYQGKQVEGDVTESNLNYPSDSQEIVNYHNQDANDDQIGGQEPVYNDAYPDNEQPNQFNEDRQPNYVEDNRQSSQSPSLPPPPQTDYAEDYGDDYYQSGDEQRASNEKINDNKPTDNNVEDDDDQKNNDERRYDQFVPEPLNPYTRESASPSNYPYSNNVDSYNEPQMVPFASTPMVTIPLNPGTEPGARPVHNRINPNTDFDLTGDPYLDNYGRPVNGKSTHNSMENQIEQINDGEYGKRNYHYNNNVNNFKTPSTYSRDQQNGESTQPAQYDYMNNWRASNDYYQQNQSPSPPPPSSTPDREMNNLNERFDGEDWGQY